MNEREVERLQYIQESIELIDQYCAGRSDLFMRERIVQDAVLRRLETLADATNQLSEEVKARHPEIRWRTVYGFRNVAAHAYEALDLSRVWQIVEVYLPILKVAIDDELRRATN
ncbi:MAG: HepT-like ribonuclease domain-containing protein [Dehalococcoidia bacterium]